jgi:hypothetical protein
MARDKSKDDKLFSCSQAHEVEYVSNLYAAKATVKTFLQNACASNRIKNSTHMQVYELIQTDLSYPIPA